MKIISKSQILALTLSLGIFLALGSASAFTPPTSGKPTSADWQNSAEPVDQSAVGQLKPGGLSVDTFFANGEALFMQVLNLKGLVNGGTETDTNSTVAFGDGSYQANLDLTGKLRSNLSFTSESLAHSGPGLEPICADTQGHLYLCAGGSTPVQCGNSVIESGEQCDDGNTTNGDGCSSTCQSELSGTVTVGPFPFPNTSVQVPTSASVVNISNNEITNFSGDGVVSVSKTLIPGNYSVTNVRCEDQQKVYGPIGTATPNSFNLSNNQTINVNLSCN